MVPASTAAAVETPARPEPTRRSAAVRFAEASRPAAPTPDGRRPEITRSNAPARKQLRASSGLCAARQRASSSTQDTADRPERRQPDQGMRRDDTNLARLERTGLRSSRGRAHVSGPPRQAANPRLVEAGQPRCARPADVVRATRRRDPRRSRRGLSRLPGHPAGERTGNRVNDESRFPPDDVLTADQEETGPT